MTEDATTEVRFRAEVGCSERKVTCWFCLQPKVVTVAELPDTTHKGERGKTYECSCGAKTFVDPKPEHERRFLSCPVCRREIERKTDCPQYRCECGTLLLLGATNAESEVSE